MSEKRSCMGCGEEVDTEPLERGGKTEPTCISCGFTLDIVVPDNPARVLRTLERKLRIAPCPVIFFPGRKDDENVKKQMALFNPRHDLSKGADGDVEDPVSRAEAPVSPLSTLFEKPGETRAELRPAAR